MVFDKGKGAIKMTKYKPSDQEFGIKITFYKPTPIHINRLYAFRVDFLVNDKIAKIKSFKKEKDILFFNLLKELKAFKKEVSELIVSLNNPNPRVFFHAPEIEATLKAVSDEI